MRIKYEAHSCFLITTATGTRVLLDPYDAGAYAGAMQYAPITDLSDVVLNTHGHADHSHVLGLPGNPAVIDGLQLARSGPREAREVSVRAVPSFHDPNGGKERGENAMILLEADGLRLCHAGDLGHTLSAEQIREIGALDILLLPVGGHYTIDADAATRVMEQLQPRITIPMHFKTPRVDFPIAGVGPFLAGKPNVRRVDGSVLAVTPDALPPQPEIIVLEPAL